MKKAIAYILIICVAVPLLALLCLFVYTSFHVTPTPQIGKIALTDSVVQKNDSIRTLGNNWAKKIGDDLYVSYTEGNPETRGYAYGALLPDLMSYQKSALLRRMEETVKGEWYRKFLCRFVRFYNSGIQEYLTDEQCRELYGLSLADSNDFDELAEPYELQLNLHAAHDIGHAMQDYMLVGCSSFVLNGKKTKDSTLLFGRNFDFYCGDEFAKTKVLSVCKPDSGYAFVSVSWGGMLGVLSGMNEKGLAVCINASKLDIPKSVAMPISMLVRHILIHCKSIDEAYAEAKKMKTFVAENIVIASAYDNDMATIEKSPEEIELYRSSDKDMLLCTNHFQSEKFMQNERNLMNINQTDTKYRIELLAELLGKKEKFDAEDAMAVLLNPYGKGGENIGLGNEMAINQLIAHHSVVFEPEKLNIYVCTQPKYFYPYIKFNLQDILNVAVETHGRASNEHGSASNDFGRASDYKIACQYISVADSLRQSDDFEKYGRYVRLRDGDNSFFDRSCFEPSKVNRFCSSVQILIPDSLVASNPMFFEAHDIAGDLYLRRNNIKSACDEWQKALECKIPKLAQRKAIEDKIKKYR
ncbi:MAG: choloylglycine hydrolase [Bacteroidales bacterium]|jgi:predicted choloylglycine hydrolase|nr:choloylglycine hydrolase [Bacteroidales bacterium]